MKAGPRSIVWSIVVLCIASAMVVAGWGMAAGRARAHDASRPWPMARAFVGSTRPASGELVARHGRAEAMLPVRFEMSPPAVRCSAAAAPATEPTSAAGVAQECPIAFASAGFWRAYFGPIVVVALVILVQAMLLWGLLWQRHRRRRAEAEAQRRRTDIAHAARLSLMGVLAASIAHEINQPLGAILSNVDAAEMNLERDQSPAELREILRDIRGDVVRASEVIRGLRRLLRKREMRFATVDVNAEVKNAMRHLTADAALRKVRIVEDLEAGIPCVAGDSVHLQQVLINLVVNAMEAMQATAEGDREVRVQTRAAKGGAEIAVRDRGPGVSPQDASHLFDSFFTTKPEGTGLGLSIVRTIVEAHRGVVTADAGVRSGATFRVWLPAAT